MKKHYIIEVTDLAVDLELHQFIKRQKQFTDIKMTSVDTVLEFIDSDLVGSCFSLVEDGFSAEVVSLNFAQYIVHNRMHLREVDD